MKRAVTVFKILLLITALLILFSFCCPIINSKTDATSATSRPFFVETDSVGYFFTAFSDGFNFNALHVLIPVAAILCMFIPLKYSDYVACGLFFGSAFLNLLLFLKVVCTLDYQYFYTYYGMIMNCICSIILLLFTIVLLVLKLIQNRKPIEQPKPPKSPAEKNLSMQMQKLNSYREYGFLTKEEYNEKLKQILQNTLD